MWRSAVGTVLPAVVPVARPAVFLASTNRSGGAAEVLAVQTMWLGLSAPSLI